MSLKQITVSYKRKDKWVRKSYDVKYEKTVENRLKKLGEKYCKEEHYEIGYHVYNRISQTWMQLYDVQFDGGVKVVKLT